MTAPAAHLVCLAGGARFTARPIRPDDKPALAAFFDRLSAESRRRRFLGPKPSLTKRDLAFLTEVDGSSHVALVALDREGRIAAVARYAAWRDRPGHAEVAFAVAEEWHGHGLASALGDRLLGEARRGRLLGLTGSTLVENAPARALLRRLGFGLVGFSGGVAEYELPLVAAPALPVAA